MLVTLVCWLSSDEAFNEVNVPDAEVRDWHD